MHSRTKPSSLYIRVTIQISELRKAKALSTSTPLANRRKGVSLQLVPVSAGQGVPGRQGAGAGCQADTRGRSILCADARMEGRLCSLVGPPRKPDLPSLSLVFSGTQPPSFIENPFPSSSRGSGSSPVPSKICAFHRVSLKCLDVFFSHTSLLHSLGTHGPLPIICSRLESPQLRGFLKILPE